MSKTVIQTIDLANPPKLSEEAKLRLANINASEVDYSDIPPLSDEFWNHAMPNPFYKPTKKVTTVRLDNDVLLWLKSQGKGYQTRMNDILRQAMLSDLVNMR